MWIKKLLVLIIVLFFPIVAFAKIGIYILPVKSVNEQAISSGNGKIARRIIEDEFSQDLTKYNVRQALRKTLEELQLQMAGLVKNGTFKGAEAVDYFIISNLWEDNELIIFEIRAMDADNCKIVYSNGITVKKSDFKYQLKKLIANLKKSLKEKTSDENIIGGKENIAVYNIDEDGNDFLSDIVTSMLMTGLQKTKDFFVVEREEAKWAVQEKEAIAAGIVNRNPLRKYGKIYNIDLSVEGCVVTKNNGIYSFDIKIIDLTSAKLLFRIYDECYSKSELQNKLNQIAQKIADKYYRKLSKLRITSIPSDAAIYINRKYWTKTPALITDIEKGTYDILLKKENYENYKIKIDLKAGQMENINVTLERLDKKYFKLGLLAEKRKKWKTAIAYYKEFSDVYPDVKESIDAKFRIAHIYQYELKNLNRAIKYYRELIKSYSGLWILSESMYGLGCSLIDTGEIIEGKKILNRLIKEYPETSAAQYARKKLNTESTETLK